MSEMENNVMIPEEKAEAVARALRQTFGVTDFEDIRVVYGGNKTSRVYRIVVGRHPYLLRISMRTDDPTDYFTCMAAAAQAGIAPRVWYTSIEDRLSITDFIPTAPLPAATRPVLLAAALRNLHALAPFPPRAAHLNTTCTFLVGEDPAVDAFLQRFRATECLPLADRDHLIACCRQLTAAYPVTRPELVSSHNDLYRPDNILYDSHRLWLVDWEAAFLNDRYADLAVAANLTVTSESEEEDYLREYFGDAPTEYQRARFFFTQQLAHVFYAMGYIFLGSLGRPPQPAGEAPELRELYRQMWAGELNIFDSDTKIACGLAHRQELLRNMQTDRVTRALAVMSANTPSAS